MLPGCLYFRNVDISKHNVRSRSSLFLDQFVFVTPSMSSRRCDAVLPVAGASHDDNDNGDGNVKDRPYSRTSGVIASLIVAKSRS